MAISNFCSTFAAAKVKRLQKLTDMAQETLESLIQVIMTLPLHEQERVVIELQDNIHRNSAKQEPTEEQKARLRLAYREAQEGKTISQEEAHQMMDEFEHEAYAIAL